MIEWAKAARPLPGEYVSGDFCVVEPFPGGVLVAAIDALGHGEDAAKAAQLAGSVLREHAGQTVPSLFELCHRNLRVLRGVVMSLASIDARNATLTWGGIGNVEGVLLRADLTARPRRESLLLRGGVVGMQMPHPRTSVLPLSPSDLLILVTDGIQGGFIDGLPRGSSQEIADAILMHHGKETDDALAVVARYLGP